MSKIRVLVVDDSALMRHLLTTTLEASPDIQVVGKAANGSIALAKIAQDIPDLVTLDVEMPVMNGLETLKRIRKLYPKLPVIMFSSLTHSGATATIDALEHGANDYVAKPNDASSFEQASRALREEFVAKIHAFCDPKEVRSPPRKLAERAAQRSSSVTDPTGPKPNRVKAVVVGVSTGGPNALSTVLSGLPKNFSAPIVIVQHMPPVFTKSLADRLNSVSLLDVKEAQAGDVLRAGCVYVAPGDYHLVTRSNGTKIEIELNQAEKENSCRPAVDVTFRTMSKIYGKNLLGVILTGMGRDGCAGSREVNRVGGRVIVQDEETSTVWGMPRAVEQAGFADEVLPLPRISDRIHRLASGSATTPTKKLSGAC